MTAQQWFEIALMLAAIAVEVSYVWSVKHLPETQKDDEQDSGL